MFIGVELFFGQRDAFTRFAEHGQVFLLGGFGVILSSREDTVAVVLLFAAVANERRFQQSGAGVLCPGKAAGVGFCVEFDFFGYSCWVFCDPSGDGFEAHPLAQTFHDLDPIFQCQVLVFPVVVFHHPGLLRPGQILPLLIPRVTSTAFLFPH